MSSRSKRNTRKNNRSARKNQKSGRSFGDRLFRLLLIVCAIALCMSYLAVFVNPSHSSLPLFFGLYYIPILLVNILLLLIALFRKRAYMLIPILALMPSLLFAELFVKFGKEEKELTGDPIKVVTYNVGRYLVGARGESPAATAAHIRDFLSREKADVICLQEFSAADTSRLSSLLPDFPYRSCHFFKGNKYFGNITLSRFPIADQGKIGFSHSTNLCIWSDIKIGPKMVRVYNCHLESYAISFTAMIKKLKGNFTDEFVEVHDRMRGTNIRRSAQVSTLLEHISGSNLPVIICGDFNDTPMSYTYHKLSQGRKDCFVEGGSGLSGTYSVLWPMLRIDYVLIPGQYDASDHTISRIPYSDHYPVSTLIYFQENGRN